MAVEFFFTYATGSWSRETLLLFHTFGWRI